MLNEEDAKLFTLAKAARARIQAVSGAAVRDGMGRTYAAANVDMPGLRISALDLAVAQAVAAGAQALEAAVVLGAVDGLSLQAAHALGGDELPIYLCDNDGVVTTVLR